MNIDEEFFVEVRLPLRGTVTSFIRGFDVAEKLDLTSAAITGILKRKGWKRNEHRRK